ncbi:MAG TPA: hypothetical protein VE934_03915 [Polaromonas sp.]|uniref:hypothetical protein n=1 Tax=Polaromonas sp. TaxID=1869339 RepID=UPI002D475C5A|nr:hypothetical protein [Polaromonas sp.]HYW56079.1 hypothetical protein [Polaromonas sp.]
MGHTSVGVGDSRDNNENDADPVDAEKKTFGEEGTNKTQPLPDPKAKPDDVPGSGKHVSSTPYVR